MKFIKHFMKFIHYFMKFIQYFMNFIITILIEFLSKLKNFVLVYQLSNHFLRIFYNVSFAFILIPFNFYKINIYQ